jgi:hypothetical protein
MIAGNGFEHLEERFAVRVVAEDLRAFLTAAHDAVDSTREFEP